MLPSGSHRPKGNHAGCPYPMRAPLQAWHATQCWPKLGTARRRGESSAGFRRPGSRGSVQWLKGSLESKGNHVFYHQILGLPVDFPVQLWEKGLKIPRIRGFRDKKWTNMDVTTQDFGISRTIRGFMRVNMASKRKWAIVKAAPVSSQYCSFDHLQRPSVCFEHLPIKKCNEQTASRSSSA